MKPVHRHSHQHVHEQLPPHGVRIANLHHLRVKRSEMRLWIFRTSKRSFWPYEHGWYHRIHDRLREGHGELSERRKAFLILCFAAPSLVRCNSSFIACDATRSSWIRSCSALDAAITSWRPCIIPITCCRVKLSLPTRAVELCLVFLILEHFLMILVPTRPRALTKVKVKHMVGTTKKESQHVDRFGHHQVWASLGLGVAKHGRRQVGASSILKTRPVILRVCFGSDVTPSDTHR